MNDQVLARHGRIGAYVTFSAYAAEGSEALRTWAAHRHRIVSLIADPPSVDLSPQIGIGAPTVRFTHAGQARGWFGGVRGGAVFTWQLVDRQDRPLIVSASAFPAIMMAEQEARQQQEFADELELRIVHDLDTDEWSWCAYRAGEPVLLAADWRRERHQTLHEAVSAVGQLAIAAVATSTFDADLP